MTREWQPCTFDLDGIQFRVRRGEKAPKFGDHVDLVMEWLTPVGWVPVRFFTVGFMVDFLYWNEQGLYPPWRDDGTASPFVGGEKLMRYLRKVTREDVHAAEAALKNEQAAKRDREVA